MDIKPRNILLRDMGSGNASLVRWKVYIADFGIARSYSNIHAVDTDGPTSFTKKYAAPEVVDKQKRGFPADIFSLGCVFLEIITTIYSYGVHHGMRNLEGEYEKLQKLLESNEYGDPSYQANISALQIFLEKLETLPFNSYVGKGLLLRDMDTLLPKMLNEEPSERPKASELPCYMIACCSHDAGPDKLEIDPELRKREGRLAQLALEEGAAPAGGGMYWR